MMKRFGFISIFLILIAGSIIGALPNPHNYTNSSGPFYGNDDFGLERNPSGDVLKVVSYNIEKSQNINEAIDLLTGNPKLSNADVILLQEMDVEGMRRISEALEMNFVYLPINSSPDLEKDFGNGVLAKDCFLDKEKIILPHGQLHNNRLRSVTQATIEFGGREILLHSAHFATVMMSAQNRRDQVDSFVCHLETGMSEGDLSIVGGDFNAITKDYRSFISQKMNKVNHSFVTQGVGSTIGRFIPFVEPELDMIFARNFEIIEMGKVIDHEVSDHFPIYAILKVI